MAIVGNAKNARLTIKPIYHFDENTENEWYIFYVSIRGQKYYFRRGDQWFDQDVKILKGTTLLANTFFNLLVSDTIVIEAIDNALKIYRNGTMILSAVDSTYLVAGDWEITEGTFVSFENLDVGSIPVTGVTLNKATTSFASLATEQLTATVAPANATNKAVTWSSSTPAVATVSATGLVTPVAAGTATITVTTEDGGKTATCVVTVQYTPVTGISVTPKDVSLTTVGQTAQLTATVAPANATNKMIGWTSDTPSVATVSSTGLVTCVSAGSAKITATTADGNKTSSVYIEPFTMTKLNLTRTPLPAMEIDANQKVAAGQTIFGDSTDITNLFDYWVDGAQGSKWGYYQTDNGIAHVVNDGTYGALSSLLAFDKYTDFSVEVEFRTTVKAGALLDTGLVLYPFETAYTHLPKPLTNATDQIGYVFKSGSVNKILSPVTIPWDTLLGQWIKLQVAYRTDGTNAYVTGSVIAGGITYTAPEMVMASLTSMPNPIIAPTTWSTSGRVMWRNLKVLTGSLAAYSFDTSRLSSSVAVNSTRANGGAWTYRAATQDFANGNLVLKARADVAGWVTGTGTLTLPKINMPESSVFKYIEFLTSGVTAGTITWVLKDASGNVKQSGTANNNYNKIPITATDNALQPEFTFSGAGTAKLHFVDVTWTPLIPHTLTYEANGGTGTIAPQTGVSVTAASTGITRVGYNLAGWNTAADGSGTAYALGATVVMTADMTLYAVWVRSITRRRTNLIQGGY